MRRSLFLSFDAYKSDVNCCLLVQMNQAYFCASFDVCLDCVVLVGLELWCVAFV